MKKKRMQGASWDSIFLASAKILTMLFGVFLSKILSVGLSLEMYGTYSQANLIYSLGAALIALGFSDAINYFYNQRKEEADAFLRMRMVNTIFFVEILLGIVLAIIILLGRRGIVAFFGNDALYEVLSAVIFLPLASNLLYFYQVLFVSVGRAKKMILLNLAMTVLKFLIVSFAVFVLHELIFLFVGLVLLDFAQLITCNWYIRKCGVFVHPTQKSTKHIKEIFSYAFPIGIYALTSTLSRELDKVIIGGGESTETLAVYTNCSRLLPFDVIVISFATVLIPYIVRAVTSGDNRKGIFLFSSYMKIGYYSVWAIATAVLIAPQTVISLLYDGAYTVGTDIFVVYVFDSIMRFASVHLVLTAANKTRLLLGISALSLLINLLLNIVLYHIIGLIGPAVATLISSLIYSYLILRETCKILQAKWQDIFEIKEIMRFALTLLIGWLIAKGVYIGLVHLGVNGYIAIITSAGILGGGIAVIHFKRIIGVLKEINNLRL